MNALNTWSNHIFSQSFFELNPVFIKYMYQYLSSSSFKHPSVLLLLYLLCHKVTQDFMSLSLLFHVVCLEKQYIGITLSSFCSDWGGKGPCAIVPLTWKMAHKILCRMIKNGPLKISKSLKKLKMAHLAKTSSQSLLLLFL